MSALRLLALVALVAVAAGCGGGPYKTAPVSGRITLNGKGLAGAAVMFQPVATKDMCRLWRSRKTANTWPPADRT